MEILETIPVFEQPGTYINLLLISLGITFISLIIAVKVLDEGYDILSTIFIIIAAISVIIFLVSIYLTITEPKVDTGRKRYIIRVNEDTSINDIYDNYKIIDHTKYTDVYTVEELEND